MDLAQVKEACGQYVTPQGFRPSYGTAGFRAEASLLPATVFRCGLLMAARALQTGGVTGLVVTASHNPVADNGVKLVDPTGYMLEQAWEEWANQLACANDAETACAVLQELFVKEDIPYGSGTVMLAHDTRPSAAELTKAAAAGVTALGSIPVACGLLTTPQLHWMVRQCNAGLKHKEGDYYDSLAAGFSVLVAGTPAPQEALVVDCANGVGAHKLAALAERLRVYCNNNKGAGPDLLRVDVRNAGEAACRDGCPNSGADGLNKRCGADYVQKERRLPAGFQGVPPGARCASLDGDADRLVYFQPRGGGGAARFGNEEVDLLDGDRIAVLAALLVQDLLTELPPGTPQPGVGIVQTAYANGASTQYIQQALPSCALELTPTGVKHLHAAAERFDVGMYWEANGHGTILFGAAFVTRLHKLGAQQAAARRLLAAAEMVNQSVGDALSGVLLVEAALRRRRWGLTEWAALYTDLPSRQLKVKVADRSVVVTANAETRVVSPAGLQDLINGSVTDHPSGRAFVRPSGTEDVVRVYAEASTQEGADDLALAVAQHVHAAAGGVGPLPN